MAEYSRSVVTFIDILGFSSLVRHKTSDEIEKLLGLAEENSRTDKMVAEYAGRRSLSFSDTIITTCPLEGPHGPLRHGLLFDEIMEVIFLQADMINRGSTFLRGAMTVGDVYHDDTKIFGPGLIDAYEMESKLSNFPRVVIDPKILLEYEDTPALRSLDNDPDEDLKYVQSLICQDSDGLWFIDYLRGMVGNFDEPEFLLVYLKNHKELILNRATENQRLNSIALKYNWLATYHNQVVNDLLEKRYLSKEHDTVFLIKKEELATMHQFRLEDSK